MPTSTLPQDASEELFNDIENRDNFIHKPPSPAPSLGTKHSISTDYILSLQTCKSLKVNNDDDAAFSVHVAEEEEESEGELSTSHSIHPSLAPVCKDINLSPEIAPSSH